MPARHGIRGKGAAVNKEATLWQTEIYYLGNSLILPGSAQVGSAGPDIQRPRDVSVYCGSLERSGGKNRS